MTLSSNQTGQDAPFWCVKVLLEILVTDTSRIICKIITIHNIWSFFHITLVVFTEVCQQQYIPAINEAIKHPALILLQCFYFYHQQVPHSHSQLLPAAFLLLGTSTFICALNLSRLDFQCYLCFIPHWSTIENTPTCFSFERNCSEVHW